MQQRFTVRTAAVFCTFAAVWIVIRYFLPLLLPFLLGMILAFSVEPLVRTLRDTLRIPRGIASVIGLGFAFVLLIGVLFFLCALAYREMGVVTRAIPSLLDAVRTGLDRLREWLISITNHVPGTISGILSDLITKLFLDSTALLDRISTTVFTMATGILSGLPDGAIFVGTMVLASFMFSVRLPELRGYLSRRIPSGWAEKWGPVLGRLRAAFMGWLKAQALLAVIMFLIVTAGLLLLRIPYAGLWGFLITLVDAIPILGTGTILIPWAILAALRGETLQALGLAGIYLASMLTRSAMEPKLVGKQLGMNPLLTLLALYAGYRIWGIMGMIFSPIIAVTAMQLSECLFPERQPKKQVDKS